MIQLFWVYHLTYVSLKILRLARALETTGNKALETNMQLLACLGRSTINQQKDHVEIHETILNKKCSLLTQQPHC